MATDRLSRPRRRTNSAVPVALVLVAGLPHREKQVDHHEHHDPADDEPHFHAQLPLLGWPESASAQRRPDPSPSASQNRPEFRDDELLVKFKTGTPAAGHAAANQQAGGQVVREVRGLDVKVVKVPSGQAQNRLGNYQRNPNVEYAELNGIAYATWAPADARYPEQWALNSAPADHDIDAPQAWDIKADRLKQLTTKRGRPEVHRDAPFCCALAGAPQTLYLSLLGRRRWILPEHPPDRLERAVHRTAAFIYQAEDAVHLFGPVCCPGVNGATN